jgi:exodeoxyribonuclease VII small subunit
LIAAAALGIGHHRKPMAKKTQTPPKSFEDALQELEQILADIEAGELGLEESLVKYERGNFLIHHCRGVLGQAEKQIELLSKSADGGLTVTPMPDPSPAAKGDANESAS